MSEKFAKLFDTAHGQILVKLDAHFEEETPEVRIYFQPKDLGVCSVAIRWDDNDEGWDLAEKAFVVMDQEKATKLVEEQLKMLER